MKLGDVLRSGDWKSEKHVPVIEAPDKVAADQPVEIKVSIGEEIPTPTRLNTIFAGSNSSSSPAKGSPSSWPMSNSQSTAKG